MRVGVVCGPELYAPGCCMHAGVVRALLIVSTRTFASVLCARVLYSRCFMCGSVVCGLVLCLQAGVVCVLVLYVRWCCIHPGDTCALVIYASRCCMHGSA